MRFTLWGTRGSLPAPGPDAVRYGGNTACVEVRGADGTLVILDAGTGLRRLGEAIGPDVTRVDLLLTHLHMDHIQGLGFFRCLHEPNCEVHLWGPPSTTLDLRTRLTRYLSPPLFPVRLRDLACRFYLHEVPLERFEIGCFDIVAAFVCHPGATVGYRVCEGSRCLAYLPDHEPALGVPRFPAEPEWTSGFDLARRVNVLIHDAQYTRAEYLERVGWGHSAIPDTLAFAAMAEADRLVTFHHDPEHNDLMLDHLFAEIGHDLPFELVPGVEGLTIDLGR